MYIRKTTIKNRKTGKVYFTYRLVEAVRTSRSVKQRILLNLGRHFAVDKKDWQALAKRIEVGCPKTANLTDSSCPETDPPPDERTLPRLQQPIRLSHQTDKIT